MKIALTCFADRHFSQSQKLLQRSAFKWGIRDVRCWSPKKLSRTRFFQAHQDLLTHPRGAGLWLWKPYIIHELLDELHEGDIGIYLDSGIEIVEDIKPLVEVCLKNNGFYLWKIPYRHRQWTKRDCFVYMDGDTERFHNAVQTAGGIQIYQKNPQTLRFIQENLHYCCDKRILTDDENTCGLPNLEGFVAHRHDQSVLSQLTVKYGIRSFDSPFIGGRDEFNPNDCFLKHVVENFCEENFDQEERELSDSYQPMLRLHRKRNETLLFRFKRRVVQIRRKIAGY